MNVILQKISEWIIIPIAQWMVTWLARRVAAYFEYKEKVEKSKQANQEVTDKVNAAVTPDEKKDAAEDVLKKF